jgi:eukaryotic-like serine/threonine-protein kinase
MARVYLAESLGSGLLRKLVVLKVLNQELASDPEMRQSFLREAEISARLNHPNIVNVHEVFEHGTTAVMVMQHLEGMSLSEILSRLKGSIPLKLHVNILCQLLDALHYFHELKDANGVSLECVHRDVSPDNVMVLHEGGIKIVDFGVAKVRAQSENQTRAGVIKGKVAYMPPEQLLACASVDRRADIYSVGVMLWEAAAGRRMWRGMDASARMRAIVKGEIPDIRQAASGVSDALASIIVRALAHTPDGRYATAEEMQIELEQVTLTEGGHSAPRELAEFMRVNFGDERREKQRLIEKVVGDREFSLAGASWSSSDPPSGANERSAVQAALAAPSVVTTPSPRWRKPLVGVALLSALGLVAAAVTFSGPADQSASAIGSVNAPKGPVTLRIDSDRPGAEVYLDGVKLGVTPLVQTRPASAQAATIELRSSGRVVQSKVVSLQDDVALNFAVPGEAQAVAPQGQADPAHEEEDAADADGEGTSSVAPQVAPSGREHDRRPALARQRRPPVRSAEPSRDKPAAGATPSVEAAPATPAAPKTTTPDSCDPPYRLDPGGVKVFKPQCF